MKTYFFFFMLIIATVKGFNVNGQCSGGRYQNQIFSSFTLDSVVYSTPYNLKMDIYRPVGDTCTKRPLILLAHEGGFFNGDRSYDYTIDSLCVRFAKRGYVTVSYDYRLTTFMNMISPDSSLAIDAVIKAVSDGKAAIRFFMKDAATANVYKIDTNNIFIGGNSAGAVLSLHLGYITSIAECSAFLDTAFAHNGGFNGNSSDASYAGYGIRYKGIINLAGGLNRTSFISTGDVPSVNFQGDLDDIVPYTCDWALGGLCWMKLCGLGSMEAEYTAKGISHMSKVFAGDGHVPWDTIPHEFKTADSLTAVFLYSLVCPVTTDVHQVAVTPQVDLYPNPADREINIAAPYAISNIQVTDATGRVVMQQNGINKQNYTVSTSHLFPGLYYIKLSFDDENNRPIVRRFLKE